ncbi:hypothetical protein QQP08_001437 [Theobroma cacao]|nr:hypothetical protein QQP08_001437 [Theobroma cacao]
MNLTNFLADPAEVESVSFDTCPGVVEKYQHVEDIHWAVRPLAIVFGLFTAMKLTMFVGCSVSTRVKKCRRNGHDGHAGGKSGWRQRIFRDGVTTARSTDGGSTVVVRVEKDSVSWGRAGEREVGSVGLEKEAEQGEGEESMAGSVSSGLS